MLLAPRALTREYENILLSAQTHPLTAQLMDPTETNEQAALPAPVVGLSRRSGDPGGFWPLLGATERLGGDSPSFKATVRFGEPHLRRRSFPRSWCGSPGSGWERARAAAPSHPGSELRFQLLSGIISWRRPHSSAMSARNDTKNKPSLRGFSGLTSPSHTSRRAEPASGFFPPFTPARATPLPVLALSRESESERELQEMRKTRHPLPGSAPDETGQICARACVPVYVCGRAHNWKKCVLIATDDVGNGIHPQAWSVRVRASACVCPDGQ